MDGGIFCGGLLFLGEFGCWYWVLCRRFLVFESFVECLCYRLFVLVLCCWSGLVMCFSLIIFGGVWVVLLCWCVVLCCWVGSVDLLGSFVCVVWCWLVVLGFDCCGRLLLFDWNGGCCWWYLLLCFCCCGVFWWLVWWCGSGCCRCYVVFLYSGLSYLVLCIIVVGFVMLVGCDW